MVRTFAAVCGLACALGCTEEFSARQVEQTGASSGAAEGGADDLPGAGGRVDASRAGRGGSSSGDGATAGEESVGGEPSSSGTGGGGTTGGKTGSGGTANVGGAGHAGAPTTAGSGGSAGGSTGGGGAGGAAPAGTGGGAGTISVNLGVCPSACPPQTYCSVEAGVCKPIFDSAACSESPDGGFTWMVDVRNGSSGYKRYYCDGDDPWTRLCTWYPEGDWGYYRCEDGLCLPKEPCPGQFDPTCANVSEQCR